MPRKALASLNVVITAVTKPLFRGLNRASKRLVAFGGQMKAIGRGISTSFTTPFAMIAAAGGKMAIDFEQSMTKINTLVGTSSAEVNKLGAAVKQMAVETATGPKELADALFFIQSAGIKGSESLDTLRVSAKGAAMQMGEITDIASATTSIMTAYGISAEKAGDLLHETLKQGKFEAEEFMNKIGQVIPTAAAFGVSFEEMGAAVATMSKISGDAAGSLTAINQVMLKLATPGSEQLQILDALNMSYDDLNTMMKDSLMGTLNHLFTELEGNDFMLTKVFGSSRAVKGAFATAGLQAETYAEVLDGMNNSMGNVNKGFETQSQTVGFTMAQAFQKLQLAAMELGSMLMPVFTKIVTGVTNVTSAFMDLEPNTKKLVVVFASLVALSGPLMTLGGGLVALFGSLLSPITFVMLAIAGIFKVVYDNWGTTKKIFVDFVNYFIDLYNESMIFKAGVELIKLAFKNLWAEVKFVFNSMKALVATLIRSWIGQFKALAKVISSALKLDPEGVKEGAKDYMKAVVDGVKGSAKDLQEQAKILGEDIAKNTAEAIANTMSREKVELITEEQVQGTVDNVEKWLKAKAGQLKGALGGSTLAVPEGGGGGGVDFNAGPRMVEAGATAPIEELKSKWSGFGKWLKTNNDDWTEDLGKGWQKFSQVAGSIIQGIGNVWAAQHEKAMTILENERTAEEEDMQASYDRKLAHINRTIVDEEMKEAAILALDKEFGDAKLTMDRKYAKEEAALKTKAAKADKRMKIMSAIMAGANAVVMALASVPFPFNLAAAAVVGTLAGIQIGAIQSTPIPQFAKGGLAFGPTAAIVGDNPMAASDPEVIAPLSKLQSMLGGTSVRFDMATVLRGNDIYLSNDKTEIKRERYI